MAALHIADDAPGNVSDVLAERVNGGVVQLRDPLYRIRKLLIEASDNLDAAGGRALVQGLPPAIPTAPSTPHGSSKRSPATCTAPATSTTPPRSSYLIRLG